MEDAQTTDAAADVNMGEGAAALPVAAAEAASNAASLERSPVDKCASCMATSCTVSMDDWECPVCCELLYKPVVPPCGHPFCFWCAHRSMSYTSVSKCPLCRSEYTHLPRVSELLHAFLMRAFPDAYREREEETCAFEQEENMESYVVSVGGARGRLCSMESVEGATEASGAPEAMEDAEAASVVLASVDGESFRCDRCDGMLFMPSVMTPCAHCLCGACSGLWRPEGGGGRNPIARCPVCENHLVAPPKMCHVLQNFLQTHFAPAMEARIEELEREGIPPAAAANPAAPAGVAGVAGVAGGAGNGCASCASCASKASPSLAASPPPAPSPSPSPSPSPLGDGAAMPLQERVIKILKDPSEHTQPEDHVHFGVGCDGCGVCPIVGERWQCLECQEKMGFDLCGHCYVHHQGKKARAHTHRHRQRHTHIDTHTTHVSLYTWL